jgi:hypothetical protein
VQVFVEASVFNLPLLGWAFRVLYNTCFAPLADRFIWHQVSKAAQGNNRPATRIVAVSRCPSALLTPLPGMPDSINETICGLANESAREAIPRIRKALGEVRFGSAFGEDGPLSGALSGGELVHTSYFRCEQLIDLVCTHIRLSSQLQESCFPSLPDSQWEHWVRQYKARLEEFLSASDRSPSPVGEKPVMKLME